MKVMAILYGRLYISADGVDEREERGTTPDIRHPAVSPGRAAMITENKKKTDGTQLARYTHTEMANLRRKLLSNLLLVVRRLLFQNARLS